MKTFAVGKLHLELGHELSTTLFMLSGPSWRT